MNKRILKGTVIALALFALIPVTNAAAKGNPGPAGEGDAPRQGVGQAVPAPPPVRER